MALVALLILYAAGTSQFELFHSLLHAHQSHVAHTVGQKMDACHVSIYFNDVENGCHHDSHLVVSDKCDMCDLAFHGDQTILAIRLFSSERVPSGYFDLYKLKLDSYLGCHLFVTRASGSRVCLAVLMPMEI